METSQKMKKEMGGCCGGGCHSQEPLEKTETTCSPTAEELTDLLKRTQANFDNYRKQMQAHVEEMKKMAAKDVILQLLPVIDHFELALRSVKKNLTVTPEFVQGMELIHSELGKVLQDNYVVQIDTQGKDFDPYYHEALMKVNSNLPKNRIMEEFQKGFVMQGKVIRHAKVKISAGTVEKNNQENKNNQNKSQENKNENAGGQ